MPDEPTHATPWWRTLSQSRAARTAVAYTAAGWGLIQVASTVMEPLGFSHALLRPIIMLIIAGFFVAVAVALGFDVARRRAAADAPPGSAATAASLAAPAPAERPQDASVAVLAFADMSPEKDQDYFCEGTAEEIISALNAVRGLRVASRSGSFQFKQRTVDSREIGRLLNVRAVLDGSVRKAGDRVRVVAQLANTSDGTLLWSETFDRRLEDIFAIQDEIARRTAQALRVALVETGAHELKHVPTRNLAAYDFFLRGRQLARREKEAEYRSAAELFRQAVRLDPQFAPAHASLGNVLAVAAFRRNDRTSPMISEAQRVCNRALELAPDLPEAHVALALVQQLLRRPADAAREFEAALALDPRSFDAHYFFARFCVTQGDHARAIEHYEQAFALQPDDFLPVTLAVQEYQAIGDREGEQSAIRRSWAAIERRLAIDPDDSAAYDHGAGVLMLLGRAEESRQFSDRAIALRPEDGATHYNAACVASLMGDHDRALDLVERALDLGYGNADWILNDNDMAPLRDHARFKQLVARFDKDSH
jgi:adenylate cyclase